MKFREFIKLQTPHEVCQNHKSWCTACTVWSYAFSL